MSFNRAKGSVNSRTARWISPRPDSFFCADGVIKLKLALPAGLGKISPSISQKALRSWYQVSSGMRANTGRRGYISLSIKLHIASDSAIWVSASKTPGIFNSPQTFSSNSFNCSSGSSRSEDGHESALKLCDLCVLCGQSFRFRLLLSANSASQRCIRSYFLNLSINPLLRISSSTLLSSKRRLSGVCPLAFGFSFATWPRMNSIPLRSGMTITPSPYLAR